MTKDQRIKSLKQRLAIITLASSMGLSSVGCTSKIKATDIETTSIEKEIGTAPLKNANTVISISDRDEIEKIYNKYQDFFKDYYNDKEDPLYETTYDLRNMILMLDNDYENISEEDMIRVLRLFQDTKDGIDLKANNYVIGKPNDVIVPQTPNFSELLKDENLKNQYNEIYDSINQMRLALNEENQEQINSALNSLNNVVIKIENHELDYSNDSYSSSSTIKYLMNSIKYDAECLAGEFNVTITYNDEWNNNSNQQIYLKCKSEKDQAIKDTFDINYIRNNDINNEDRLEKQTRIVEDVDGNKYETEVKGYYIILEDGTNFFATVQDYERILDYLAPSKFEDIMLHLYYDLSDKVCTTENGLKAEITTNIYLLNGIKNLLQENRILESNKELVFKNF